MIADAEWNRSSPVRPRLNRSRAAEALLQVKILDLFCYEAKTSPASVASATLGSGVAHKHAGTVA